MFSLFEGKPKTALAICGIFAAGQIFYLIKNSLRFPLKKAKDAPLQCENESCVDPVHLHIVPGSYPTVSFSPFSSKIVLYCRLAGIPHTTGEPYNKLGSTEKAKAPFAVHAGQMIEDSQLIIRYLENTFDVVSMAKAVPASFKSNVKPFVCYDHLDDKQKIARTCHCQGFARHSPADQLYLARRAVKALSVLLGPGPFFLGDSPSECDCAAYGLCEGLMDPSWPNPLTAFIRDECPNLVAYVARVRGAFFPDLVRGVEYPPGLPGPGAVRCQARLT